SCRDRGGRVRSRVNPLVRTDRLTYLLHNQLLHLQQSPRPVKLRARHRRAALRTRRRRTMEFGYFTLSDNHYEKNPRDANQFITDIAEEALYADQIGMHSAWIGEHHFNALGVLSSPELVLAYIAARTKHIRLAPAVNVTPLHHPIRVAEQ